MRIKISVVLVFVVFMVMSMVPGAGICGSVIDLLPKKEEVYSKLPKNPYGDPELPEAVWDKYDDILSESPNNCVKCHYSEEKYEKMTINWYRSKHGQNKVYCTRCHGGNQNSKTLKQAKGPGTGFKKLDPRFKKKKGPLASFDDLAFEYCGQCHGTIYRDWRIGIHGKRTGSWNGKKEYRICVYCHNPHNPKFPQIKPMPPPWRPGAISTKLHK